MKTIWGPHACKQLLGNDVVLEFQSAKPQVVHELAWGQVSQLITSHVPVIKFHQSLSWSLVGAAVPLIWKALSGLLPQRVQEVIDCLPFGTLFLWTPWQVPIVQGSKNTTFLHSLSQFCKSLFSDSSQFGKTLVANWFAEES